MAVMAGSNVQTPSKRGYDIGTWTMFITLIDSGKILATEFGHLVQLPYAMHSRWQYARVYS